jgi:pimeloyl-ACP methyl ester carboxylesterase
VNGPPENAPPPLSRLMREAPPLVLCALAPLLPTIHCEGNGKGVPVLVFPGLLCSDATTSRLRRSLDAVGFRSAGWGLGLNRGLTPGLLEACRARLESVAAEAGEPVILLGWSLGGLYAREVAKVCPGLVRCVITLGSPFSGDLHGNNAWRIYEWLNDHKVDELPLAAHLAVKPPVPTVAAWSPKDGIVSPGSARGEPDEADRRVALHSTHMGMGVSAAAVREVVGITLSCLD